MFSKKQLEQLKEINGKRRSAGSLTVEQAEFAIESMERIVKKMNKSIRPMVEGFSIERVCNSYKGRPMHTSIMCKFNSRGGVLKRSIEFSTQQKKSSPHAEGPDYSFSLHLPSLLEYIEDYPEEVASALGVDSWGSVRY